MDKTQDREAIKTQQGFSFHILELPHEDAKIYTDLLERNGIWYQNITTSHTFIPLRGKKYPPQDLNFPKN